MHLTPLEAKASFDLIVALLCEEGSRIGTFQSLVDQKRKSGEVFSSNCVDLIQHHLLGSRLFRFISQHESESVFSANAQERALKAYLNSSRMHTLAELEISRLASFFGQEKIEAVFIKGWVYAKRYYAYPEDRPFFDIDILFRIEDRPRVEALLPELSLQRALHPGRFFANQDKIDLFHARNPSIRVECHFALGYRKYALKGHWGRLEDYRFKGTSLFHLSLLDEYLYLIYHAVVQHRFQKLGWLLDLAQMRRQSDLSFQNILNEARKYNLTRAVQWAESFLFHFCGVGTGEGAQPDLETWFHDIATGEIENSLLKRARLRAMMQGGWGPLIKYALMKEWAIRTQS